MILKTMLNILFMCTGVQSIIEETKTKQGPFERKIYCIYIFFIFKMIISIRRTPFITAAGF